MSHTDGNPAVVPTAESSKSTVTRSKSWIGFAVVAAVALLIVGGAWVLGLLVFAYSQAASIVSLYPTQADLDRLARTASGLGANPAVVALQGPAYDASTYGGATAWQVVTPGVLLIGLMSIMLVTRHTRQEEETGRAELASSGVVGRHAWLAAALLYVLVVNLVLAALSALGYVSQGLPAAGSVALALAVHCG